MESTVEGSDWIICFSAERLILHGAVECPRQGGREVSMSACHDCRLLEYAHDERDRLDPCSDEPPTQLKPR